MAALPRRPVHGRLQRTLAGVAVVVATGTPLGCTPSGGSSNDAPTPSPTDTVAATAPVEAPSAGVVDRVVDGDTLVVRFGAVDERVRLIGIDTPESVKPDSPVECFGHEASDHLAELLPPGTAVTVLGDVEVRDAYGRLLGYVFRSSDDLFVNLAMAADGFANSLTITPNVTFADDFRAAVAAARAAGSGLWRACPDPDALFGTSR